MLSLGSGRGSSRSATGIHLTITGRHPGTWLRTRGHGRIGAHGAWARDGRHLRPRLGRLSGQELSAARLQGQLEDLPTVGLLRRKQRRDRELVFEAELTDRVHVRPRGERVALAASATTTMARPTGSRGSSASSLGLPVVFDLHHRSGGCETCEPREK